MSGLGHKAQRAVKLARAGRHAEAVSIWEQLHRQAPANPAISLALGAALLESGRDEDAVQWLAGSCQRHPEHFGMARLLGQALMRQDRRKEAIGAFYHALSLDPESAEIHANLASALYWERSSAAALPHAEFAFCADRSTDNICIYLTILFDLGHREETLALIERLLADDPAHRAPLLLFRATAHQAMGRLSEALLDGREAVGLMPDNLVAQHHFAASLLLQGHLTPEAWGCYEGREGLLKKRVWPEPKLRWTDQEVRGRTILVHAEQGHGDTLQFIRYVPIVEALGARVIVAVQPPLVRLLQGTPGATEVVMVGTLPPFDLYCPLLSLPGRFSTTLQTIPPPLPYALTLAEAPDQARLQVGIVWAGLSSFVEDRKRSLSPALLAPLADISDVDFHSLQYNATELPLPGMRNAMEGVGDFADTAERIATLDIVIAVDTSVAHLAATMGKPVWLLNRYNGCWRWLLEREDSPWYPSVRIFRQPMPDDWTSVIAEVRDALAVAAAERQQAMSLAA